MPFYEQGDDVFMEQEKAKFENKGRTRCEVYSRVVGFLSPVSQWNIGKQAEFKDRKTFDVKGE